MPRGIRTILGLTLIAGGVFGFLPVLGFWMIPLGLVLIALDIPPLRRRMRGWLDGAGRPGRQAAARSGRRGKEEQ